MKALQRRFITQLLIISIALYGVSKFIMADMPLIAMLGLLFAVNSVAFILVTNTKENKPRSFVYSYMIVSFGRLIICSLFVFSYALLHRHDGRTFALSFFVLYFLYNIVEVRAIYTFFKN
jgi:hypothetical protein